VAHRPEAPAPQRVRRELRSGGPPVARKAAQAGVEDGEPPDELHQPAEFVVVLAEVVDEGGDQATPHREEREVRQDRPERGLDGSRLRLDGQEHGGDV
jgi:hypothetical protein